MNQELFAAGVVLAFLLVLGALTWLSPWLTGAVVEPLMFSDVPPDYAKGSQVLAQMVSLVMTYFFVGTMVGNAAVEQAISAVVVMSSAAMVYGLAVARFAKPRVRPTVMLLVAALCFCAGVAAVVV